MPRAKNLHPSVAVMCATGSSLSIHREPSPTSAAGDTCRWDSRAVLPRGYLKSPVALRPPFGPRTNPPVGLPPESGPHGPLATSGSCADRAVPPRAKLPSDRRLCSGGRVVLLPQRLSQPPDATGAVCQSASGLSAPRANTPPSVARPSHRCVRRRDHSTKRAQQDQPYSCRSATCGRDTVAPRAKLSSRRAVSRDRRRRVMTPPRRPPRGGA